MGTMTHLKNTMPGHSKFWACLVKQHSVTCFWGKIGTDRPQSKRFVFDTADEAQEYADRKVESKLSRGYRRDNYVPAIKRLLAA